MPGIGSTKLAEVITRAAAVDKRADQIKPFMPNINTDGDYRDYRDYDDYDDGQNYVPQMNNYSQQNLQEVQYSIPSPFGAAKTTPNLPKEILNEMIKNPIDTSVLGVSGMGGSSVLDGLPLEKKTVPQRQQRVQSTPQYPTIPPTNYGASGIDYSLLKSIIDESISRHINEIKANLLTENKITGGDQSLKAMKIGEKFQFIDGSGNLYEAKLKFIKTIPKK